MKNVLLAYYTNSGHTSRVARCIQHEIFRAGAFCDVVPLIEILRDGIDWDPYDVICVGAPIKYGTYRRELWEFASRFKDRLDSKPNSFFNLTVVARNPEKATLQGNRYMQRFLKRSPWKPRDVKCFAGKVDYPNWNWMDTKAIQLIMLITHGPTDPKSVIDYTDYNDVKAYARHLLELEKLQPIAKDPIF